MTEAADRMPSGDAGGEADPSALVVARGLPAVGDPRTARTPGAWLSETAPVTDSVPTALAATPTCSDAVPGRVAAAVRNGVLSTAVDGRPRRLDGTSCWRPFRGDAAAVVADTRRAGADCPVPCVTSASAVAGEHTAGRGETSDPDRGVCADREAFEPPDRPRAVDNSGERAATPDRLRGAVPGV